MDMNIALYCIGLLSGMLITVYTYYKDKRAKNQLDPGSFNIKYLFPSALVAITLIPLIEAHILATAIPADPTASLFRGISAGLVMENGWRLIWKAYCILSNRYTN